RRRQRRAGGVAPGDDRLVPVHRGQPVALGVLGEEELPWHRLEGGRHPVVPEVALLAQRLHQLAAQPGAGPGRHGGDRRPGGREARGTRGRPPGRRAADGAQPPGPPTPSTAVTGRWSEITPKRVTSSPCGMRTSAASTPSPR